MPCNTTCVKASHSYFVSSSIKPPFSCLHFMNQTQRSLPSASGCLHFMNQTWRTLPSASGCLHFCSSSPQNLNSSDVMCQLSGVQSCRYVRYSSAVPQPSFPDSTAQLLNPRVGSLALYLGLPSQLFFPASWGKTLRQ